MPVLAAVLLCKRYYAGAIIGFLCFVGGVMYLVAFVPWRYKNTPFWKIYIGILTIILIGAVGMLAFWRPESANTGFKWSFIAPLFVLLMPLFTLGRKTWSQMHGE
jgi:hypothetical protein